MNIGVTINLLSGGINGITRVHYRPRNTQTWRLQELSLNTVLKMLLGQRLSPISFLSKLLFWVLFWESCSKENKFGFFSTFLSKFIVFEQFISFLSTFLSTFLSNIQQKYFFEHFFEYSKKYSKCWVLFWVLFWELFWGFFWDFHYDKTYLNCSALRTSGAFPLERHKCQGLTIKAWSPCGLRS